MECPNLSGCPIYAKFKTEALKNIYVRMYCMGKSDNCKRKQLKASGKPVPPNLLPDGKELEKL